MVIPLAMSLLAAAPTTKPTTRPLDPGVAALISSTQAIQAALPRVGLLRDPQQREKRAPIVVPLLKDYLVKEHSVIVKNPRNANILAGNDVERRAELLVFGESDQIPEFPDAHVQVVKVVSEFILADRNRQAAIVSDTVAKLKADPLDLQSTLQAVVLHHTADAAAPELDQQVMTALNAHIAARLAARKAMVPASKALTTALLNKPLTLQSTLVDGKAFSTDAWKGKVVLVDFWATWCGPCKAGLPHVKEIYKTYHSQGLEIIGVSNDYAAKALTSFLKNDPEMAWPQFFDEKAADSHSWNALSAKFGVDTIPRMFLIDKQGICRSITARQDMDVLIPKLLAEPSATTQPAAMNQPK